MNRRYRICRFRQIAVMLVGYAPFYVCRLAFSATKKSMVEQGVFCLDRHGGVVGSLRPHGLVFDCEDAMIHIVKMCEPII